MKKLAPLLLMLLLAACGRGSGVQTHETATMTEQGTEIAMDGEQDTVTEDV
ncbi:MAG: hypothetical protein J6F31_01535 [Oscillospiraceae bacterium]|nr:hypothetical protein [Oscillospiraceae bacterium]